MANTFAPFGFTPLRRVDGAAWTSNMSVRKIKANDTNFYFFGDPVVMSTANRGYITPMATAAAATFTGIFVGCEYLSVAKGYITWSRLFPGGDTVQDVIAYVIDDPNVVFAVQTNNSAGGATAVQIAALGDAAQIGASAFANGVYSIGGTIGTSGCGNTLNGNSGVYLDQNSFSNSTGSTFPFKIYDIPNVQTSGGGLPSNPPTAIGAIGNGADPSTPFNIVYVTVNAGDLRAGVAGV